MLCGHVISFFGIVRLEREAALRLQRFLVCCVIAAAPATTSGQDFDVRLEGGAGQRLGGALVALVDSTDRVHVEVLSGESGRISLAAPAGNYRVRVRRIGFRPFYSDTIRLPRAGELVLRVESPRVVLDAMVVSAKRQCGAISRDAQALSEAWEEISKALRASQLTATDLSAIGTSRMFKREVSPSGHALSADTTTMPAANGRPFAAIDPSSLLRDGFVRGDPAAGWEYFGPDERVLLSSAFAATHCFRIARDRSRPGELGVSFEPVSGRRISDIRGVLWLDAASSELREITFRFVNIEPVSSFGAGGFTRFRRMPSGAWIVSEWQLRMPKLAIRAGRAGAPGLPTLIGYHENGGVVTDSK